MPSYFESQIPPRAFKSDGCSGGLSKWWKKLFGGKPPISESCFFHDVEYHWGAGPDATWQEDFIERLAVDLRFGWSCFVNDGVLRLMAAVSVDHLGRFASWKGRLRCARDGGLAMLMAPIVFLAVRFGGGSYWPTSYRWGFGRINNG